MHQNTLQEYLVKKWVFKYSNGDIEIVTTRVKRW